MKGERYYMLSKEDAKRFLRIMKNAEFIKYNVFCKQFNVSQPALSKFINSDEYDDFISEKKILIMCDAIYNGCGFITDAYREIMLDEKIV